MKYRQYWPQAIAFLSFPAILMPLALFSTLASSQEGPGSIPLGPFDLQASVLVEYAEDDNLYQSSEGQISTSITTVAPVVELLFDNGVSGLSLTYGVESATFSDVNEDYTDQRVDLSVGTTLGSLHRFEAGGAFVESHDRQAAGTSDGVGDETISSDEIDYFEDREYEFAYTLGAETSLFNLLLSAREFERTYIDNRVATAEFDLKESQLGAGLLWNFSSSLSFGASYTNTEIEYVESAQDDNRDGIDDRDGDEQVIAFNVQWEPINSLSIDLSIGETDRSTETSVGNTSDYWDITLVWNPVSYSSLALFTSSYTDEVLTSDGGFSEREGIGFRWAHDWSERFETEVSYVDGSIAYVAGTAPREDTSESIVIQGSYQLRSWVAISAFAQNITIDTAGVDDSYDQNIYGISALFQL